MYCFSKNNNNFNNKAFVNEAKNNLNNAYLISEKCMIRNAKKKLRLAYMVTEKRFIC